MKTIIATVICLSLASCAGVPTGQIKSDWSPEVVSAVQNQALMLGMTKDQVVSAWGRPDLTRRSISANGEIEIWQYGTYHYTSKKRYLSFVDGKLVRVVQ